MNKTVLKMIFGATVMLILAACSRNELTDGNSMDINNHNRNIPCKGIKRTY